MISPGGEGTILFDSPAREIELFVRTENAGTSGTVTTLVAIPFLAWRVGVMRAGAPAGIEMAFIAMIVVWNLAVIAHVLRHALSTSFAVAVVIAIVMYLVSSQVLSVMLEGRMTI